MSHHEQACCAIEVCCGTTAKRIEAIATILRAAAPGPDKYVEMAAVLVEQKVVRMASVFVTPAFFTLAEVAGFLEAFHRGHDKYVAMATALLNQGYVVSIADLLWPPVLYEVREGLECIGIPYDGEEPAPEPEPMVAAAVVPTIEAALPETPPPPKPKARPKATPKKVVRPKKK